MRKGIKIAIIAMSTFLLGTFSGMFISDAIRSAGNSYTPKGTIEDIIAEFKKGNYASVEKEYNHKDFALLGLRRNGTFGNEMSSTPRLLSGINSYWPLSNLNKSDESYVYTFYSVKAERDLKYRMLLFFAPVDSEKDGAPKDMELWTLTGRVFFVSKRLSHADFSAITAGSTLNEVAMVDPVALLQKPEDQPQTITQQKYDQALGKYVEEIVEIPPVMEFETCHYLTDGILSVTFSRNAVNEEFKVSNIVFNPAFEVVVEGKTMSLRINREDYPA